MKDMASRTVLKVSSLSKSFSGIQAVRNISFRIEEGDIFAFLGPNGAGKTTTLRILLDIIKPDSGHIEWQINGDSAVLPNASDIGYLPEERGLYTDIPVIRSLIYLASIRGMDPKEARNSAYEWLERLELANRANEKLQVLSKGNQQKIQFVASILHKPRFAILDEPFSGFDPVNQEKFIGFIKDIHDQGTTILMSAHQMSLVEKIADKIFLINNGREVYNGTLNGIYKEFGEAHMIDLHFKTPVSEKSFQTMKEIESVKMVDNSLVRLTFNKNTDLNKALVELAKIEGISTITSHKPDLHDIFLQLVKTNPQ